MRVLVLICGLLTATSPSLAQCGVASWYDYSGHRTASGERFPTSEITVAHPSLPLGSRVVITDQRTGRSIRARVNDRGPYVGGRVVDLSPAAARALGGPRGLWRVCLRTLGRP